MAPRDVCHGYRCSPAGLGPMTLEYRSCHWPGGLAVLPQCVQPLGCASLRLVPLLPSVLLRVRCLGPLSACSPVRAPCVFRLRCPRPLCPCSPVGALCAACACCWWLGRPPPPSFLCLCFCFFFLIPSSFCLVPLSFYFCLFFAFFCLLKPCFFFEGENRKGARVHCRTDVGNCSSGAAVLCSSSRCASLVLFRRSRPSIAARAS